MKSILLESRRIFEGAIRSGRTYYHYFMLKRSIESGNIIVLATYKTKEEVDKTFKDYFDIEIDIEEISEHIYKLKLKV